MSSHASYTLTLLHSFFPQHDNLNSTLLRGGGGGGCHVLHQKMIKLQSARDVQADKCVRNIPSCPPCMARTRHQSPSHNSDGIRNTRTAQRVAYAGKQMDFDKRRVCVYMYQQCGRTAAMLTNNKACGANEVQQAQGGGYDAPPTVAEQKTYVV